MPESPLTDAMRHQLTPTENAESTSEPELCCTLPAPVALDELQLLVDLRACLPERTRDGLRITRIGTSGVLRLLEAVPGSPWRGLSPHKLARMLGSFGVHPHVIRFNHGVNSVRRGYIYDEMRGAFLTRLPPCDNPGLMRGPSV
jgi:hypothetical protein